MRSTTRRYGAGIALVAAGLALAGCAGGAAMSDGCGPCAPVAAAPCADRPPEAQAGEAWCRVWVPDRYGMVVETVCVKPATSRQIQIPAKYGTRPKLVCTEDPKLCERTTPAVWATKKQPYMVCPPREEVRRVCCPTRVTENPCEVQCDCWTKVEIPAQWDERDCPVCVTPSRTCVEYTPAQYKVVPEQYLIEPARCEMVCEPPVFEQRCRKVVAEPGHWEWRRNEACEVPAAPCAPSAAAPSLLRAEPPEGEPAIVSGELVEGEGDAVVEPAVEDDAPSDDGE